MGETARADAEVLTRARFVAVAFALVVAALGSSATAAERSRSLAIEAAFVAAFVAAGLASFVLVDALRFVLRLGGGERRHVVVSILEGAAVFTWGFVAEPFASLEGPRGFAAVALLASLVGVHAWSTRRAPRVARVVVVLAGATAVVVHTVTAPSLYGSFHAAACLVAVASAARIGSWIGPSSRLTAYTAATALVAAFVTAESLLSFPETRARFRWGSSTATALAKPLVALGDLDRDGASSVLHATDCAPFDASRGAFEREIAGDGIDQDCDGFDLRRRAHAASGTKLAERASTPDILVISLDALRADEAHRLVRIREALGEHFEFTSCVSPSARTMNSFAAMMRGRTVDELPFGRRSLRATLTSDDLPTIGGVLAASGFRSAFVATHSYLAPRTRIVSGFEFLRRASMPYDDHAHRALEAMLDADVALDLVLGSARTTTRPLFVWTHLMETHTPYRESRDRIFGTSRDDYRRAIDAQDRRVADAIRRFRDLRGRDPIVVVLGDHGEAFGEHGERFHSSSLHTEQTRVPFLLHVPGSTGRRIDAPVSTASLAATLADLVDADGAASFPLRSLVPCLSDDARCPEVAVSELFSLARPGDVAMRAYTSRTERTIVDRAHDVARTYDRRSDPRELRPETTTARDAVRRVADLDDGR